MATKRPKPSSSNTTQLLEWTAAEAIQHIKNGDVTAESYAVALLQHVKECESKKLGLSALTWIDEAKVRAAAKVVDATRKKGMSALDRLAGLPLAIKDNIATAGFPTSGGTAPLKKFMADRNAIVVDTLFASGGILLAKTNMDELGRGVTTTNQVFGIAKNPYDLKRVPGGGAGGTAVAIAARYTPAGLASDTAGSARMPASFCGVSGFRPTTRGRTASWDLGSWAVSSSRDGVIPISYSLTTPAPMGRTVGDVALLHAIVTGQTSTPLPMPLAGVKIGVPWGFYWDNLDPEVLQVCEQALDKLRDAGVTFIDVNLRAWANAVDQAFNVVAIVDGLDDLAEFLSKNGAGVTLDQLQAGIVSKDVQARLQRIKANPVPAAAGEAITKKRRELSSQYEQVLLKYNLSALIFPTVPALPPMIRPGGDQPGDTIDLNGQQVNEFNTLLRNTHLSGVVGTPSLVVPAGVSSTGLPVAISLEGMPDHDDQLLSLGLSVEAVLGRVPGPVLTV
jgi:indoleacetamide hydrolase